MKDRELIDKYESKRGKKPIVNGKETIGFKRWKKQQRKSDPKLDDAISTFRDNFKKDINDIVKIYLEKANISPSSINTIKYLKKYIESVFPSKVLYKDESIEIDSDGVLDLSYLNIKDLRNVKGLFKLRFLKQLNLSENKLDSLPEEIANLTNLIELKISYNDITKIPKNINTLINLKRLILDFNDISKIPKWISNLTNLKTLYMENNNISKIPKWISNLTNLEHLNIDDNDISEIPKEIGNLTNLIKLYMSYNDISTIPREIGNLTNLEKLYIEGNDISELPKEIGNLMNLKVLSVKHNNIAKKNIPKTILNNKDIRLLL